MTDEKTHGRQWRALHAGALLTAMPPITTLLTATLLMALLLTATGCNQSQENELAKAPRPVAVMTLKKQIPNGEYNVSGAVKSWKKEQIGFEVSGRVEWVLEPGRNVERQIKGEREDEEQPKGEGEDESVLLLKQGTPLAKIDPRRYEVAHDNAKAKLSVAILSRKSIEIRLNEALDAELKSAEADRDYSISELKRLELLRGGNAVSEADIDEAQNVVQTKRARVSQIKANTKQAEAELKSAEAEVESARLALADAKRDLDNTVLYTSYHGQISDTHVVPGSLVTPGSPVLTLHMMDPIKIVVEVSAEKSRELQRRSQIPISFTLPNGKQKHGNALVYNIDTSAEPTTRTFSLTLLMKNEKYELPLPNGANDETARARFVWPLDVNEVVGAPANLNLVEGQSIYTDDEGPFVFRVTNASRGDLFPEVLEVAKTRVRTNKLRIGFLGIWTLQSVDFLDSTLVNKDTLIAGNLESKEIPISEWKGNQVIIDSGTQWVLRPGDLVNVDLSSEVAEEGFYVPANAVYEESGKVSIFVVKDNVAREVQVTATLSRKLNNGSLVKVDAPELEDGMQVVIRGVHFLDDGDRVRPLASDPFEPEKE